MQRNPISDCQPCILRGMDHDQLLWDCLKHKPEAQKKLYDFFAPSMLAVCYRYTKNMDDAENILQDGFVKVFQHLKKYRGDGELGAWIRKIMVNTALNYLKTSRNYQYDLLYEESPLHAVSAEDPEVKLNAKEIANLVRQLPTGFQTIFNLYAVEGYKHVEIATLLGISEGTSRSQYARARSLLIEWMEKTSLKEKGERYGRK